jgi:hypothetical protein
VVEETLPQVSAAPALQWQGITGRPSSTGREEAAIVKVNIDRSRLDVVMTTPTTRSGQPTIHRWIKTECGRAKLAELAARTGPAARLRLFWFVLVASIRDWNLPLQP